MPIPQISPVNLSPFHCNIMQCNITFHHQVHNPVIHTQGISNPILTRHYKPLSQLFLQTFPHVHLHSWDHFPIFTAYKNISTSYTQFHLSIHSFLLLLASWFQALQTLRYIRAASIQTLYTTNTKYLLVVLGQCRMRLRLQAHLHRKRPALCATNMTEH